MDNKDEKNDNSRRRFLSLFFPADQKASKPGMVKMLTADGKLVEVDKSVVEAASKKQKSSNKEIYDWMENPSKENNS